MGNWTQGLFVALSASEKKKSQEVQQIHTASEWKTRIKKERLGAAISPTSSASFFSRVNNGSSTFAKIKLGLHYSQTLAAE